MTVETPTWTTWPNVPGSPNQNSAAMTTARREDEQPGPVAAQRRVEVTGAVPDGPGRGADAVGEPVPERRRRRAAASRARTAGAPARGARGDGSPDASRSTRGRWPCVRALEDLDGVDLASGRARTGVGAGGARTSCRSARGKTRGSPCSNSNGQAQPSQESHAPGVRRSARAASPRPRRARRGRHGSAALSPRGGRSARCRRRGRTRPRSPRSRTPSPPRRPSGRRPRARAGTAIAEASVQPVPWVCALSSRAAENGWSACRARRGRRPGRPRRARP